MSTSNESEVGALWASVERVLVAVCPASRARESTLWMMERGSIHSDFPGSCDIFQMLAGFLALFMRPNRHNQNFATSTLSFAAFRISYLEGGKARPLGNPRVALAVLTLRNGWVFRNVFPFPPYRL